MSESESKFKAMEKYYQCMIKQQQEEIKELKLQLLKQNNSNEYESNFEQYIKILGYERVSKN